VPWSSLQATNQPMPEREGEPAAGEAPATDAEGEGEGQGEGEGKVLAELEVRTFGHGDVTLEPPAGG
jgi:hypothetical protein